MIWQDYRKLYANALKTYSPKFKKELQKQVDTFCRTQDYDAISDKALKKTIKQLHVSLGTKMALTAEKDVKKATKGYIGPFEGKSQKTDLFSYLILQYLERQGLDQLASDITGTTKDQIRRYLMQGAANNLSYAEMIPMLRQAGITDYRAELIARTETSRAANTGSMVGAMSTGLVTVKEWIAAKDNRTRRIPRDKFDHLHMDGKRVAVDEPFTVPGMGSVEQMEYPGDSRASAGNVCNCRCTVGFEVVRDENDMPVSIQGNLRGPAGTLWSMWNNSLFLQLQMLINEAI